jgi:hypothetical protein
MPKKIKSFTVDEQIYNALVGKFKTNKANSSISLFLNHCLTQLNEHLDIMGQALANEKDLTVPMGFVIDEMAYRVINGLSDDDTEVYSRLMDLQEDYEADSKGIPRDSYFFIKRGGYRLSPDKKYIIENETGIRYIAFDKHLAKIEESD